MKTLLYLFCIILILSNIEVQGGSFSIDDFLDYLQEKGYYDIIQAVKNSFGDDIAIAVCEELVKSNDCEIVVRIYMTNGGGGGGPNKAKSNVNKKLYEEIIEYLEKIYKIDEKLRELIELILSYYSTLIESLSKEEIINLIKRIIDNQN